jgi:hypothetical protein
MRRLRPTARGRQSPDDVRWGLATARDPLPPLTNDRSWGTCFDCGVVSRLRPRVKQTEHLVDGVNNRLRLVQLNLVT